MSEDRVAMSGLEEKANKLREPLLLAPPTDATPPGATEHAQMSASEVQDSFHSVEGFGGQPSSGYRQYRGGEEGGGGGRTEMTVVELHTHSKQ